MYEPVKFKRLKEIAAELHRKLEQLHTGELSKNELEKLTDESRELYERLVVLRFKAFDEEVKNSSDKKNEQTVPPIQKIVVPEKPEDKPTFHFSIEQQKQEVPQQVSLIDAIAEVTKEEHLPVAEVATNYANTTLQNAMRESVHDRLVKNMDAKESLAEKLEHNPISDLKRAITLNQRFQFSKELFKGNNQEYEVAIDKLNNASREEAMQHMESLKTKYAWSEESPVVSNFAELVERRHQ